MGDKKNKILPFKIYEFPNGFPDELSCSKLSIKMPKPLEFVISYKTILKFTTETLFFFKLHESLSQTSLKV